MPQPTSTKMQRAMSALQRIRAAVANVVSGGEIEAARNETASAVARAEAAERETEQIVVALEDYAAEVDPPAAPAEPPAGGAPPAGTQHEAPGS